MASKLLPKTLGRPPANGGTIEGHFVPQGCVKLSSLILQSCWRRGRKPGKLQERTEQAATAIEGMKFVLFLYFKSMIRCHLRPS
jgi:hypothetical protein